MTLLYYDPIFLEHRTGDHPENSGRLSAILRQLEEASVTANCQWMSCPAAQRDVVTQVHRPHYLQQLYSWCEQGGGQVEQDTFLSPQSYRAAEQAAGAAVDAVSRILDGQARRGLCLVRPPGHHALADRPMGFCLLNNVAIAARHAVLQKGADRVLIVDWDVHHGNGTQATFWSDPQVGFLSIHRWPFYPGTGGADEVGEGRARGTKANIPVAFGTSREDYLDRFSDGLSRLASKIRPELVLISAGFDAHHLDPIGSLGLHSEDFQQLTQIVLQTAAPYADGRVVSVLEGGYHPSALARSVESHLAALTAEPHGDELK